MDITSVIIFCNTKIFLKEVQRSLVENGHSVGVIVGGRDMTNEDRKLVLT